MKKVLKREDFYTRLLNVANHHDDPYTRQVASSHLSSWQTAGGPNIIRDEVELFLSTTEHWEKNILKSL